MIPAVKMNIDGLLEFYRKVSLKDGKAGLSDRYVRGATSLASVRGELLHDHIGISPFDTHLVVIYGIVSESHPQKSAKWKLERTKEIFAEKHDATSDYLLAYLQRKSV